MMTVVLVLYMPAFEAWTEVGEEVCLYQTSIGAAQTSTLIRRDGDYSKLTIALGRAAAGEEMAWRIQRSELLNPAKFRPGLSIRCLTISDLSTLLPCPVTKHGFPLIEALRLL